MREIKFRVWDKQTKSFVLEPRLKMSLLNCTPYQCDIVGFGNTIQQYTGCLDKNNKEIYEGDIVRFKDKSIGFVEFIAGMYVISYQDQTDSGPIGFLLTSEMEVIGNVCENKELL